MAALDETAAIPAAWSKLANRSIAEELTREGVVIGAVPAGMQGVRTRLIAPEPLRRLHPESLYNLPIALLDRQRADEALRARPEWPGHLCELAEAIRSHGHLPALVRSIHPELALACRSCGRRLYVNARTGETAGSLEEPCTFPLAREKRMQEMLRVAHVVSFLCDCPDPLTPAETTLLTAKLALDGHLDPTLAQTVPSTLHETPQARPRSRGLFRRTR
jgi:hypothetical protein